MNNSDHRIKIKWKELYQYMTDIRNSGFPKEIRGMAGGDTQGCMGDDDACMLYALVRYFKPVYCLETGRGRGKSAAFILKAFKDGNLVSHLISIERLQINTSELIPSYLRDSLDPINGTVEEFVGSDTFKHIVLDMFLHDSTHRYTHQMWEFNMFWEKLGTSGILCSHDVDYNDSFLDFVKSKYVVDSKGLTDFEKSTFGVWSKVSNFGFVTKK